MVKINKIVPDTSVLISGILSGMIEKKELKNAEIIIPEFVMEELRAQASRGREIGFSGLEEIKTLRSKKIKIKRYGRRQTYEEIQLSKYGRIDALILDVAKKEKATLYTADYVQHITAQAEGVKSKHFPSYDKKKKLKISSMITDDTMSLHLKEGVVPLAKKGFPGSFELVPIREKIISSEELDEIINEIMQTTRYQKDSFLEMSGHTASVIQMGDMRISITRPPFSDAIEVTVVRPIIKLTIDDYKLSDKLKKRLNEKVDGVIISGPPGSGKSTFAASIAEFLENQGKIVKTLESPRDLQVSKKITQYSKLRGSFENTADLLLLVRPDYTVFDEVRKTEDFSTFSDLRLAGIGMIGVVHATDPIDSVHRFIGRIELGMIPHIIDTIIYINKGAVDKVYTLSLVVRTPTGMTEADLARPVVEIRDFESQNLEYEIYTYGEENIVIPITKKRKSGIEDLARKQIISMMRKFDQDPEVDIIDDNRAIVKVDNDSIARIIGKKGKTIKELEERLGISIEVSPKISTLKNEITFDKEETGAYIVFMFPAKPGEIVNFYIGNDLLFSATLGKNSTVRVSKNSDQGKDLLRAILKNQLKVFI